MVCNLCLNHDKPFTLIAPTRRFLTPHAEQLLEKRNALFLALSEEITFSGKGVLQAKRPYEDIFTRFQKEIHEPDSGGMVHFPTPAGISWEAVTIQFVDGHTVSIRSGKVHRRHNYTQMGMASIRNGEPTKQWTLLLDFAENRGEIDKNSQKETPYHLLKKQKQELSRRLRVFLRIDGDPIEWIKEDGCYRCRFMILQEGPSL
ncbi:hypothetical protein ACFL2A_06580 [Thermodesulfobacteriota bacterium]